MERSPLFRGYFIENSGDTCAQQKRSYVYSSSPSFFCKIEETHRPPISENPKGWTPELARKIKKLKLAEK